MHSDHGFVETRSVLRVAREEIEQRLTEGRLETRLAGAQAGQEMIPRFPLPIAGKRQNSRTRRSGGVTLQGSAERRRCKQLRLQLTEQTAGSERPQQPIE